MKNFNIKKIWKVVESVCYLGSMLVNIVFALHPFILFFDGFQSKLQAALHSGSIIANEVCLRHDCY